MSEKDQYVTQNDFKSELESIRTDLKQDLTQEIKQEINNRFNSMETAIFIKLASLNVVTVAVAFIAFAYINDYRLDFTNEQNNARFERLESVNLPASRGVSDKNLGVTEALKPQRSRVKKNK